MTDGAVPGQGCPPAGTPSSPGDDERAIGAEGAVVTMRSTRHGHAPPEEIATGLEGVPVLIPAPGMTIENPGPGDAGA